MEAWRQGRNEALAALDMEWARKMMPTASNDHVLLIAMHKARYDCVDIAPELRHQSGYWLRQQGYGRMDGTPLLPEGELPQLRMDIVERLRVLEADHEPDGWPAVRMRDISALCDEVERLRTELRVAWTDEGVKAREIDKMVNRFLCWRMPEDFAPDCYIWFDRASASRESIPWPVGTNLFTAAQARAMFEYCLEGEGDQKAHSAALRDVEAERRRQVDEEGWTPEHDDSEHRAGDMARAAGMYASNAGTALHFGTNDTKLCDAAPYGWPWEPEWWKPTNARRDLVKAGALILAEIERLDRLQPDKQNA